MARTLITLSGLITALMITGCQHNSLHNADNIVTKGWANQGDPAPDIAPTHTPTAQNLYCYKSLAQIDCFTTPQPGKEHLRVGQSAPANTSDDATNTSLPAPQGISGGVCTGEKIDVHALPMIIHKDQHEQPTP